MVPVDPLQLLRRERPAFHAETGTGARTVSWGIGDDVLEFLARSVPCGGTTLETGSGYSTVVFLARSVRHIAIAPDDDERIAITRFCREHGIDPARLDFHATSSQRVLPLLELPPLDVVLIDGDHAFPAPFIDWYYTADALRRGGLLLIDDVQLRTGRILRQFLAAEPQWRCRHDIGKTAVFQKLVDGPVTDRWWGQQPWMRATYPAPKAGARGWIGYAKQRARLRSRIHAVLRVDR